MRLIDADALDESFRESISKCKEWMKNADEEMKPRAEQAMVTFMECSMRLKKEPTVETTNVAERKKSKWKISPTISVHDVCGILSWGNTIKCSNCGFVHTAVEGHYNQYNYCPECGADMRGEQDAETD